MAYRTEAPTVTEGQGVHEDREYNHPAFGCVRVSRPQSGGTELFGSALKHNHFIEISISKAKLQRGLHNDHVYEKGIVASIMVSEAQWATIVASTSGGVTPCTFRYHRDGPLVDVPGIESIETVKETFEREIKEKCAKDIKEAKDITADLEKLIEEGKIGKTQLREILRRMQTFSGNFTANMGFTQEMFAETMEKSIEAGKVEFESFVAGQARALGLEAMRNAGELPVLRLSNDKKDGDHE